MGKSIVFWVGNSGFSLGKNRVKPVNNAFLRVLASLESYKAQVAMGTMDFCVLCDCAGNIVYYHAVPHSELMGREDEGTSKYPTHKGGYDQAHCNGNYACAS